MRSRLLLLLFPILMLVSSGHGEEPSDPVPLLRLQIPADRLTAEKERLGIKRLSPLPRNEFEDLVHQAGRAADLARKQPRLVETHYRAHLVDTDLVGSGQWKAINPAAARTRVVLPLPNLNVALRQPRFENREALLADFDGKTLGLLLDEPGEQTLLLDWSARGERQAAGLSFDLELPSSPVSTLELELPRDRVISISSSDGCIVSGVVEAGDKRLWKLGFAGRTQVHFTLRQIVPPDLPVDAGPLVLTNVKTTQDLEPDGQEVEFVFDVRVLSQGLPELRFQFDSNLRPLDVAVRGLESWHVQDEGTGSKPATLLVRLREPFLGGLLTVRCSAPLTVGNERLWSSPWMRLVGAVSRGENLKLRVHRDLRLNHWQSGGFLLGSVLNDHGTQELTLTGGGLDTGGTSRPSARIPSPSVEYRVRQQLWWQLISPRPADEGPVAATEVIRSNITAQLIFEAVRGSVFQLAVGLPPDYDLERVQLTPTDQLRHYYVRPDSKGKPTLFVDLQRPLTPPVSGIKSLPVVLNLGLRLRKPAEWERPKGGAPSLTLLFPEVAPRGNRILEGDLAIELDQTLYDAQIQTIVAPTTLGDPGPWGKQTPDYGFAIRGQPLPGRIKLQPRRPRVRVRCSTDVALQGQETAVVHRLTLQPDVGQPETVDLLISGSGPESWEWKTIEGGNSVIKVERLSGRELAPHFLPFTMRSPLDAAILLASPARSSLGGAWWRLTLARPLRDPVTLETIYHRPLAVVGQEFRFAVPLPTVPGAANVDGEVKLTLPGAQLAAVDALGLRDPSSSPPTAASPGRPSPWRVFRYGAPPVWLTLRVRPATTERQTSGLIDRAEVSAAAGLDGQLAYRLRFRVWHWPERLLPLRLPLGTRLAAVWVDGRCLPQLPPPTPDIEDVQQFELPVPAGPSVHEYEVLYGENRPAWTVFTNLRGSMPLLPVDPLSFRFAWRLPPGVLPLTEGRWRPDSPPTPRPVWEELWQPVSQSTSTPSLMSSPRDRGAFDLEPDWIAWEPLPGTSIHESLTVVRRDGLFAAGAVLAVLLLLAFALIGAAERVTRGVEIGPRGSVLTGWRRRRFAFLLVWLGLAALCTIWLPSALRDLAIAPLAIAGIVAVVWYLRAALSRPVAPSPSGLASHGSVRMVGRSAGVVIVGLIGFLGLNTHGAAPEPTPVFLVGTDPAKQTVYAPPELLKQLRDLVDRPTVPRDSVLLNALYEGEVRGDSARFDATFQAQVFPDEPCTLTIPLTGVRLEEVLCDGAIVFPTVLPPPKPEGGGEASVSPGYAVKIEGVGRHVLKVRFRVPIAAGGDDREVQFGAPRLAQNRLTLKVPPGSTYLHAPVKQGAAKLDPDGQRLEVDLGRLNVPLQVRWRQASDPPQPPITTVREVYLWDLNIASSTLTGLLQYGITQGSVSHLEMEVPEMLDVRGVEVFAPRDQNTSASPIRAPRLKEWQLVGGDRRRLRLEFVAPVSTGVLVRLDLIPRRPFGMREFPLPLPVPVGARTTDGSLAYRADGLLATFHSSQGVAYLKPTDFAAQWKLMRGVELPPPAYACFFRRETPPTLVVRLNLLESVSGGTLEVLWRPRSQQADLTMHATVKAARSVGLSLVECEVPESVTVATVSGPDVRNWSRNGNRVQIWLQSSTPTADLTLTGWWSGPTAPLRSLAATLKPETWELPRVTVIGLSSDTIKIRVRPEPGWSVETVKLQNLIREPRGREATAGSSTGELTLLTQQPDYRGTLLLRPTPPDSNPIKIYSLAEVRDGRLWLSARILGRLPGDERSIIVRLRGWDGEGAKLSGPNVGRLREGGDRWWPVALKPANQGRIDLTLTAAVPLEKISGGAVMPDIVIEPDPTPGLTWMFGTPGRSDQVWLADRWVSVVGPGLLAQAPHKLELIADNEAAWKSWPRDLQRGGREGTTLWKVQGDDWSLRLTPWGPAALPGRIPVRVYLMEHAVKAESEGWSHQATFWLFATASTDLQVGLPSQAEPRAATVNGEMVVPVPAGEGAWWLPLPGGAGPRCVRLRWSSPRETEGLLHPHLTNPRLEGASDNSAGNLCVWMVEVPMGLHALPTATGATGPAPVPLGVLALRRAEAQVRISEALIETARLRGEGLTEDSSLYAELKDTQKRFAQFLLTAHQQLSVQPGSGRGPRGQSLGEWLQELEQENQKLARDEGFEALRQKALESAIQEESPTLTEPLAVLGTGPMLFWQGEPSQAPEIRLSPDGERRTWQSLAVSGLLLTVLLTAWVLSFAPGMLVWARTFWPEQLVLLACLGWQTVGLNGLVLLLATLGVFGRIGVLMVHGFRWLLKPRREA